MPGPTPNKKLEILQRRQVVCERYLRGQSQYVIARSLEVTQKTVSLDLAAIRAEWRQSALLDFDAKRDEELAKLDVLEREYWDAWERSKTEKQHTRTRKRTGKAAGDEAEVRKEPRDGNPKFLEGVHRCIELRCRILGFVKEKKEEPPPPAGDVILNQLNIGPNTPIEDVVALRDLRQRLLGYAQPGGPGPGPVAG